MNPACAPFPDGAGAGCSRDQVRPPWPLLTAAAASSQGFSRLSDRSPDQQENDGPDGGSDQVAPEIRHDLQTKLFEQKAADDGADKTDRKIIQQTAAPAQNLGREPSGDQADDEPGNDAHSPLPDLRCGAGQESIQLDAKYEWRHARPPSAFSNAMVKKSRRRSNARVHALILGVYTTAVFLSALLLFGVQPMFTRMVLPQLGGSPSVWSVAMVFFQSMLLAGYAYAHVLMRARGRLVPVLVHLALLCAAGLTLPLVVAPGWGAPPAAGTEFWLLGLFTVSIGLPFFALAANNPLLQA